MVVSGVSAIDRLTLNRIKTAAAGLDGIEFEFWTNRPLAQMSEGLASLPKGSAILLSSVQRERASQPYYGIQIAQMITPTANAPVFTLSAGHHWQRGGGRGGGG